ncbi:MarR family transcriptional regulator [Allorhizobium sp. BGMRC 0089]|uniref:MarR family winged helix-turn-helix transcriptional regulator n=1 Tax=Allorhizobium sonneratiae TaxID=2934936 RepID=UPI002034553D|nr:MarR family transcriptional regulator [Allorhizobium sonneratiae]MCM2290950.1 MarR family transcriptional regulator [Allorhizobium sonneratiae]
MTDIKSLRRLFTARLLTNARLWRRHIDAALVQHGLSEACAAPLIWISRLGGGIRQIALAEHVGIEGPSLVRLLDQLEGRGLVERRDDPNDRRAKGLWLTEAGETMAARIEALFDDERETVLSGISPEELTLFLKILDQMQERCSAERVGSEQKD